MGQGIGDFDLGLTIMIKASYGKVFVPLTHDGLKAWNFKFVCPGFAMSVPHEGLLLLKNSTVNRNLDFDPVCKEKQAVYAIKNQKFVFEVSENGKLVKYPVRPYLGFFSIAWDWELEAAFFELYNVKPQYIFCDTWGILNYTTGKWSAAVGLVQRDEADVATCCFTVTHSRSKVAEFTPGINYFELDLQSAGSSPNLTYTKISALDAKGSLKGVGVDTSFRL